MPHRRLRVSTADRVQARAVRRSLSAFAIASAACAARGGDSPPSTERRSIAPSIDIVMTTSEGDVHCRLDADHAPRSVTMFVGFAEGGAPHVDGATHETSVSPFYRDMAFFRAIEGGYVQSGCPNGDGTGTPGYRIPLETTPLDRERLAAPGVLFFARYQPPPNRADPAPPPAGDVIGSQFVIALTDMSHLSGEVTVLGACRDLDVVERIAERVVSRTGARLVSVRVAPQ
jgi:peptidyl-prolyl cis-trans isomerase A (cyclophilin A)